MKKNPFDKNYIPKEIIEFIDKGYSIDSVDNIFTLLTKKIRTSNSYASRFIRHELKKDWKANAINYLIKNKSKIKQTPAEDEIRNLEIKLIQEIQKAKIKRKGSSKNKKTPLGGYDGLYFLSSRSKGKSTGKKAYSWIES